MPRDPELARMLLATAVVGLAFLLVVWRKRND